MSERIDEYIKLSLIELDEGTYEGSKYDLEIMTQLQVKLAEAKERCIDCQSELEAENKRLRGHCEKTKKQWNDYCDIRAKHPQIAGQMFRTLDKTINPETYEQALKGEQK